MKCARCSAEIPAQSQFCLRCGTPVHAAPFAAPAPNAMAYPAPRPAVNKRLIWVISALVLALLGLGALFVRSALFQKPASSDNGKLVQAPGQGGAGALVQAPGDSRAGAPVQAPADSNPNRVTQRPQPTINTAEIDDYLRFVKGCEDQKMAITKKEMADTLASYAGQLGKQADAATDDQKSKNYLPSVSRDSSQYDSQWDRLVKYFNTRTPPQSCIELHDKYYAYLGRVEAMFVKLHSALNEAQSDPNKALQSLTAMQGSASTEADSAARAADDALDDICKKYNLRKEFEIKTDPSSSSGLLR